MPSPARPTPPTPEGPCDAFRYVPRFTAGLWYFSEDGGRLSGTAVSDDDLRARLDAAAALAEYGGPGRGLVGLEARYPTEVSEANLPIWEAFQRDTGVRLVGVTPYLDLDVVAEAGALSSASTAVRHPVIRRTAEAFGVAREIGADFAGVWAGPDAYLTPFARDMVGMRRRFAEGLAEAMEAAPGVRVALDVEPYEPRARVIAAHPAEGVLLCRLVEELLPDEARRRGGAPLVGLDVEIGHRMGAGEDLPGALSWPLGEGRLAHVHWNTWPLHTYPDAAGLPAPTPLEAGLYACGLYGYEGHIGIDLHPAGTPPAVALRVAMDAVRRAAERLEGLDPAALLEAADAGPASHPEGEPAGRRTASGR